MERYHIKIGFIKDDIQSLKAFTNNLNSMNWQYTSHCLDNIKYRVIDIEALLLYIKDIILNYDNIFEYYKEQNYIIKVCYRIPYLKDIDIILVLNDEKSIITIYINSSDDE